MDDIERNCSVCGITYIPTHWANTKCDSCAGKRLKTCVQCGEKRPIKRLRKRCEECRAKYGKSTKPISCDKDPRPGFIYSISHPVTNEVRYIGKTGRTISVRYSQHKRDSEHGNARLYRWWRKVLAITGEHPVIEMLEKCDPGTLDDRECYTIEKYKQIGARLVNATTGGSGSYRRAKMSEQQRNDLAERNRLRLARNMGFKSYDEWVEHKNLMNTARELEKRYLSLFEHYENIRIEKEAEAKKPRVSMVAITSKGMALLPVGYNRIGSCHAARIESRAYWWLPITHEMYAIASNHKWHTKQSGTSRITARCTIDGTKTTIGSIAKLAGIRGNFSRMSTVVKVLGNV